MRATQFFPIKTGRGFFFACLTLFIPYSMFAQSNTMLSHTGEVELRYDKVSSESADLEYRLRYTPKISFNEHWQFEAFIATGDDFSSSHNVLNASQNDYIYLRRLFMRHSGTYGKTEIGIIPTFKGRVSSSGLAQDGWIKGFRHVRNLNKGKLELVIGELDATEASAAFKVPEDVDYFELEYSSELSKSMSYEFSVERMKGGNFIRSEVRKQFNQHLLGFVEFVYRTDSSKSRTVAGIEGDFTYANRPISYELFHTYVSANFGERATLTEDFLDTGHGVSGELSSEFLIKDLELFAAFELLEQSTRFQVGTSYAFGS